MFTLPTIPKGGIVMGMEIISNYVEKVIYFIDKEFSGEKIEGGKEREK